MEWALISLVYIAAVLWVWRGMCRSWACKWDVVSRGEAAFFLVAAAVLPAGLLILAIESKGNAWARFWGKPFYPRETSK